MDIDAEQERLLEDIVKLAASRKRAFKPITVLIDGPSGSGKTWTSAALADRTNWRVVHLDEFYPGWHGLEKGSEMVGEQVLRTLSGDSQTVSLLVTGIVAIADAAATGRLVADLLTGQELPLDPAPFRPGRF